MSRLNLITFLGWYKIVYLTPKKLIQFTAEDYEDEYHKQFIYSLFPAKGVKDKRKKNKRKIDKISFKY